MKKSKTSKSEKENGAGKNSDKKDFLIAGIGASADGIQALKSFFENVPADSGAAYVVILHLSPDYESRLAEVLQRTARIPVTQVKERVKVEPNHVYVVPPNRHLEMLDGHIGVEENGSVEARRAPIDIFFRTLAESHRARAVSVILSGTGADGSMGLKRVKERGGVVFVQNPREAEFSEMPRNSIATNLVDAVLNVSDIPAKIVAYKTNSAAFEIAATPEARPENEQAALREIFALLRVRTGHDFTNYKHPTVLRRIERRINVRDLQTLADYAVYMRDDVDETVALLKDLLISVTNFFRDKEAFEFLETEVVPRIVQDKSSSDEIRAWVAGCATGEEAYGLAMLFAERFEGDANAPKIQIFATDIDEDAVAHSREGFYTLIDAADVSAERLQRFFVRENGGYRVRRELREMILFAKHNVLKDPPFSRLDLVTCRNLLIYLNHTAQQRTMETFHFALNPGSFLFLGTSESVDGAGNLYAAVNKEFRIYQSRQASAHIAYPVPGVPIRVLIAEDHETVREGLRLIVDGQDDMRVCGEAANGREAIRRAQELLPDVLLMDISMPELNGLTAAAKLKRVAPQIKILTLTRHTDDAYLQKLLQAGVSGYVLKQSAASELLRAVRIVAGGGNYLDPAMTGKVFGNYVGKSAKKPCGETRGANLTDRESEVLRHIALGYSNKEIADKMDISVKTAEAHKANCLRKLNMKTRKEIISSAILQGWMNEN